MMTTSAHTKDIASEIAGACACYSLRRAARKISRTYDEALKPAGIKSTQVTMLSAVALNEGAALTALADALAMERTTFLRNLAPLEKNGWIRIAPEGYRRTRTVALTAKGSAALKRAHPLWKDVQARLRKNLGANNLKALHAEMNRLAAVL